ncbi:hypothetical protein SDC9_142737 [bioreactor metagenome]|uniref:Uncharacterized protein n=1 Tax=bioreactor metagenome TaxID=1076179 RepID=A0A645E4T1_9ZZZZ
MAISEEKPEIAPTGGGDRQGSDIRKNAGNPYIVDYTSLYREYPKTAANTVFNGSFELGMKDWYPRATRSGDTLELPDPATLFRIAEEEGAPHGGRFFPSPGTASRPRSS